MKVVQATDFYEGKDLLDSGKWELVIVALELPGKKRSFHAMMKEGEKSVLFKKSHKGWAEAYLNEKHFVGYKAYYKPGLRQPFKDFLNSLREVFQEEIEVIKV